MFILNLDQIDRGIKPALRRPHRFEPVEATPKQLPCRTFYQALRATVSDAAIEAQIFEVDSAS